MGDYAWSEHIVMVFLACQITIKNVQVQLTVKGKTTPDSYTPTPSCNNVAPVTNLCLGRATTWSHSSQWSKTKVPVET